jgi:hypothetical protein
VVVSRITVGLAGVTLAAMAETPARLLPSRATPKCATIWVAGE